MKAFVDTHGKYVELSLLGQRILLIADAMTIKEILMKRPNGFRRAVSLIKSITGFDYALTSLLFSEGEMWRRHRRLASPSFNHRNVRLMGDVVNETIDGLIARIQVGNTG